MTMRRILTAAVIAFGMMAAPAFADGKGKGPVIKKPTPLTPQQEVWNNKPMPATNTCSCDCDHTQHVGKDCHAKWSCEFPKVTGRVWHQPVPGGPYEILKDVNDMGSVSLHSSHHSKHHVKHHSSHSSHSSHVVHAQTVQLSDGFFASSNGGVGTGVGQNVVGGGGFIIAGGSTGTGISRAAATRIAFGGRRIGRRGGGKH